MRTDEKSVAVPIGPLQQLAGDPFASVGSGANDIEASCLEIPIRALGRRATSDSNREAGKDETFEEDSTTMLLFPRGAVIRLSAPVESGQDLMLINKQTNRYVHCRITNLRTTPEVSYVEIEFTHTISDFWGISFPRDAAKVARAIAAFPARVPSQMPPDARVDVSAPAPARAMAAAAGTSTISAGAVAPSPAPDSTIASLAHRPSAMTGTDEQTSPTEFFVSQPTECVLVCEPMADPRVVPHMECAEAAPVLMNWEAISVPKPQGNRTRLRVAAVAAVCAVLLGYRFYSPVEAALPMDSVVAASPNGESSQPVDRRNLGAVPGETSEGTAPAGATIVKGTVPEIELVEARSQRVVLAGKMTLPVQTITNRTTDAPEIPPTAGEESASAAPGKALGLLAATSAALPPPPAEEAPLNAEKATESLTPVRLVSSVQPTYPPAARQAQIQGNVVIEAMIDASGNVVGMKVLSGPLALREAATTAVAKWKFQPALLGDRPTASTHVVTLRFHL